MIFCGQCGLQLAPNNTICPRCGAAIDPDVIFTEDPHSNDPTAALPPKSPPRPSQPTVQRPGPFTPAQQQPLILRPDGTIGNQLANEPTSLVDSPAYGPRTPMTPSVPSRSSYPGFTPQSGADYLPPTQQASYPGLTPQSNIRYQPLPGEYIPTLSTQPPAPVRRGRSRVVSLLVILFGLLVILSAMAVFILQRNDILFRNAPPTPTATSTPTPSQRAQALVQQYYNDINDKDYQASYSLLGTAFQQSQPYDQYSQGYAHTRHDDISFISVTPQTDGTVQVVITIHATEDDPSGSGTVVSNYQASYIVGPDTGSNGPWKILSGTSKKLP
jgi:hypothetical protein